MSASGDVRPWLDHVAFAVPEIKPAAELIMTALGGEFQRGGDNAHYGFRTAQFHLRGEVKLELLQPTNLDSDLQRFLDERGPGVHHVTFLTENIVDQERDLRACGYRTTGTSLDDPNWRETYLGPSQGLGTILQFADTDLDWHTPWPDVELGDVLNGMVTWRGATLHRNEDTGQRAGSS